MRMNDIIIKNLKFYGSYQVIMNDTNSSSLDLIYQNNKQH